MYYANLIWYQRQGECLVRVFRVADETESDTAYRCLAYEVLADGHEHLAKTFLAPTLPAIKTKCFEYLNAATQRG